MGAAIWIGGDVNRRTAKRLCKAICQQGVSLDWDEPIFEPSEPEDLVKAFRMDSKGPLLFLCDSEALWGEFQSLEGFLVQHSISFMRQTDGYNTYGPELTEYRPHIGPVHLPTDSGGEPLVALPVARSVERALKQLLTQRGPSFSRRSIGHIWRELHQQLPPDVPRLTPFRLV